MKMNTPNHVAIIMDGNGRWATKRGLNRSKGHAEGSKVFLDIAEYAFNSGIKVLSFFAFSTENFNRSSEEVNYLMGLFSRFIKNKLNKLKENNIRIVFSGRKDKVPASLIKLMVKAEEETKNNSKATLNICLNYGGRSEIVDAVKSMIINNVPIDIIDEEVFKNYLYKDLPEIDLVIRTSGEYRISNFMLYQMAYAELYFTNIYWPDFKKEDLDKALEEYNNRHRRFGKA